jgi:hypothetical protein
MGLLGWGKNWVHVGGDFTQRVSKDRLWVELKCPQGHIGMYKCANLNGQRRFINRHSHGGS